MSKPRKQRHAIRGIAIGYFIMGVACLTESMPPVFVQHMVGLILMTLSLIIWRNIP